MCKDCQREYAKEHYDANKAKYLDKAKSSNKTAKERNLEYVLNYLRSHPCACGESDVAVLQFDHIEMVRGRGNRIGNFLTHSLERLKEEIAKCEVRCGNCHIRRTREQMGWIR